MNHLASPALRATLCVAITALLALIPVTNVLVLIAAMLPLWVLSGWGVPGLGHPLNGFFIPSALGWTLAACALWLLCFFLLRRKAKSGVPAA